MHASWEPCHSRNCDRVPWQQYVKLGDILRHFGYTVVALHGCLQTEIQVIVLLAVHHHLIHFLKKLQPCYIFRHIADLSIISNDQKQQFPYKSLIYNKSDSKVRSSSFQRSMHYSRWRGIESIDGTR